MEVSMTRRSFLMQSGRGLAVLAATAILPLPLQAHHGWGWATDEEFELTGKITKVMLGNPHGELHLDVNGESWMVEIGQPWRNERAGLTDELLAIGTEVKVHGHRSADPDQKLMKAERLVIAGKDYNLYPDRES
jgi:hypothetical protein